jgi:hypothetical protein
MRYNVWSWGGHLIFRGYLENYCVDVDRAGAGVRRVDCRG